MGRAWPTIAYGAFPVPWNLIFLICNHLLVRVKKKKKKKYNMLHYYKSVNKKVFPCNITVNVLCIPLISHCYGNIFAEHIPHENKQKLKSDMD